MKGAIASVEIFVFAAAGSAGETGSAPGRPRRLSLVIGTPERTPGSETWQCRVALADLHRPERFEGCDSIEALFRAVERARSWLAALEAEGCWLARDRAGTERLGAPFLA
jgi:hypothetical protein